MCADVYMLIPNRPGAQPELVSAKARFIEPMLLLRTEKLPEAPDWLYELKTRRISSPPTYAYWHSVALRNALNSR